jgi:hypothetical protein
LNLTRVRLIASAALLRGASVVRGV